MGDLIEIPLNYGTVDPAIRAGDVQIVHRNLFDSFVALELTSAMGDTNPQYLEAYETQLKAEALALGLKPGLLADIRKQAQRALFGTNE